MRARERERVRERELIVLDNFSNSFLSNLTRKKTGYSEGSFNAFILDCIGIWVVCTKQYDNFFASFYLLDHGIVF